MTSAWSPPVRLDSYGPIALWNALVSHSGAPVPLAAKGARAVIAPTDAPQSARLAALVEAGALRALLLFDSFPFASLFEASLETDDLADLPPPMRDVLVEGMVASLWSLIPDNRLPRYSITGVGDWQEEGVEIGRPLDWLAISIEGAAPQPIRLRVGCRAAEVARAIVGGDLAAPQAWSALRACLTVTGYFSLGRISLPCSRVHALAAGDVIVLPPQDETRCEIRCGREAHQFRWDDDWIYFGVVSLRRKSRSPKQDRSASVTEEEPGQQSPEDLPSLANLMIELDFEIGETSLPLSTIETWRVGAVVELDPPDRSEELEVTIRAGGQAIAKGDLIRIDDRFAVKLNRLLIKAGDH